MANFVYTEALNQLAQGGIDFSSDDFVLILVDGDSTADADNSTGRDANTVSAFSTGLSEYSDASYGRKLTASAHFTIGVSEGAAGAGNNTVTITCTDTTWSALDNPGGTTNENTVKGAILATDGATDANRVPVAWFDSGGFGFIPGGGDVTLSFPSGAVLFSAEAV